MKRKFREFFGLKALVAFLLNHNTSWEIPIGENLQAGYRDKWKEAIAGKRHGEEYTR